MKRQLVQLKSTLDEIKTLTEGKFGLDGIPAQELKTILAKHEDEK
jgi:hypothetical protein